ncbi:MAG: hypothetical protein Q4G69_04735 [Planctomycetia bacterium]|nr:hypothetical protein [Planctomycetia bacterium]
MMDLKGTCSPDIILVIQFAVRKDPKGQHVSNEKEQSIYGKENQCFS